MMGYLILSCILGGSTLSSASVSFDPETGEHAGGISWDVGIVIVAVISLFVRFRLAVSPCTDRTTRPGFLLRLQSAQRVSPMHSSRVVNLTACHSYERFAWIPVSVVFLIATGISGKRLSPDTSLPAATAPQILSFGATVAGFVISYCPLSSDFTTYMRNDVSSYKVFVYTYFGFMTPIVRSFLHHHQFSTDVYLRRFWSRFSVRRSPRRLPRIRPGLSPTTRRVSLGSCTPYCTPPATNSPASCSCCSLSR